jgi:hypothetical protein
VYAAGEKEPATHHVVHTAKELHVTALDLRGDPDAILADIGRVAEQVAAFRNLAHNRHEQRHATDVLLGFGSASASGWSMLAEVACSLFVPLQHIPWNGSAVDGSVRYKRQAVELNDESLEVLVLLLLADH